MNKIGGNLEKLEKSYIPSCCDVHGAFESVVFQINDKIKEFGCPECSKITASNDKIKERESTYLRNKQIFIDSIGKDEMLKIEKCTFDTYTLDNTLDKTQRYRQALAKFCAENLIKNFEHYREQGAVIGWFGTPGTGKTHLGYAVTQEALWNYSCIFTTYKKIAETAYDQLNFSTRDKTLWNRWTSADFLLIDEVGLLSDSLEKHGKAELASLIVSRHAGRKVTLLIGNSHDTLDPLILSRMQECGKPTLFLWEDYRVKKGNEQRNKMLAEFNQKMGYN